MEICPIHPLRRAFTSAIGRGPGLFLDDWRYSTSFAAETTEDAAGMTKLELKAQLHIDTAVISRCLFGGVFPKDSRGLQEKRRSHHANWWQIIYVVQQVPGADGKCQIVAMSHRRQRARAGRRQSHQSRATSAAAATVCWRAPRRSRRRIWSNRIPTSG